MLVDPPKSGACGRNRTFNLLLTKQLLYLLSYTGISSDTMTVRTDNLTLSNFFFDLVNSLFVAFC